MRVVLEGFAEAPGLALSVCLSVIGRELLVEVTAPTDEEELLAIHWPKPIVAGQAAGDLAMIPFLQGMVVPGDWPVESTCAVPHS